MRPAASAAACLLPTARNSVGPTASIQMTLPKPAMLGAVLTLLQMFLLWLTYQIRRAASLYSSAL